MQKVNVKKIGILGLVLTCASGVVAFVAPKTTTEKNNVARVDGYSATRSFDAGAQVGEARTCEFTNAKTADSTCDIEAGSGTTGGIVASSDGSGATTE